MRASLYLYEPRGDCVLCGRHADRVVRYSCDDCDLDDPVVDVPMHRACGPRAGFATAAAGAFAGAALWAALVTAELIVANLGRFAARDSFAALFARLPGWLVAIDGVIALLAGLVAAARSHAACRDRINRAIRLKSYPVD